MIATIPFQQQVNPADCFGVSDLCLFADCDKRVTGYGRFLERFVHKARFEFKRKDEPAFGHELSFTTIESQNSGCGLCIWCWTTWKLKQDKDGVAISIDYVLIVTHCPLDSWHCSNHAGVLNKKRCLVVSYIFPKYIG